MQTDKPINQYLGVGELARLLQQICPHVTKSIIQYEITHDRLMAERFKKNGRWQIKTTDVLPWLKKHTELTEDQVKQFISLSS